MREWLRVIVGWPARTLMDRRIEWMLGSINYRQDRIETELRHATEALGEALLDRRLARFSPADEIVVAPDTARFLNWAEGPEGPASRAGLWFNPPVPVEYQEDAVEILLVNERIVEQPYAFSALAPLDVPARILDVGGSESTIALSLASLGHHVHVVDPRGYRLTHPLLREHRMRLDELPGDLRFDAALAISSLEHFGLSSYGQPQRGDDRADIEALDEIRRRLKPAGLLVLTVPCATASSFEGFQRRYALGELSEMLAAGWELTDFTVVWREDLRTWVRGSADSPKGDVGVALITAVGRQVVAS